VSRACLHLTCDGARLPLSPPSTLFISARRCRCVFDNILAGSQTPTERCGILGWIMDIGAQVNRLKNLTKCCFLIQFRILFFYYQHIIKLSISIKLAKVFFQRNLEFYYFIIDLHII